MSRLRMTTHFRFQAACRSGSECARTCGLAVRALTVRGIQSASRSAIADRKSLRFNMSAIRPVCTPPTGATPPPILCKEAIWNQRVVLFMGD